MTNQLEALKPIGWLSAGGIFTEDEKLRDHWLEWGGTAIPVYTFPARDPLNDDAITEILNEHGLDNVEQAGCHIDIVKLIRDVELAHGIE